MACRRRCAGLVMVTAAFAAAAACSGGSPAGPASAGRTPRSSVPSSTGPSSGGGTSTAPGGARPPAALHGRVVGRLPSGSSRAVVVDDAGHAQLLVLAGLGPGDVSSAAVWSVAVPSGHAARQGDLAAAVHDAAGALLGGTSFVFGGGAARTVATVQAWDGSRATVVGRLPRPRSDSAAAVVGTTAYVVGGFDGSAMDRDVLATTDGRRFRVVGRLAVGVRYPAVAAVGGAVYVVGGQLATTESTLSGGQSDDVQRFDPATGRTTVVAHLPAALGHAMAAGLGGSLYVLGGRHGTTASARIWRLDAAAGRMVSAGALPEPVTDAGVAVAAGAIWLVGGEQGDPSAPLRTVVRVAGS